MLPTMRAHNFNSIILHVHVVITKISLSTVELVRISIFGGMCGNAIAKSGEEKTCGLVRKSESLQVKSDASPRFFGRPTSSTYYIP